MPQNKEKLHLYRDFKTLARLLEGGSVFCAFDTETTGLHAQEDFLMEIGAVKFTKDGVIATYDQLIKPPVTISSFVTSITHIDDNLVKDSPNPAQALTSFLRFSQGTYLIAHNAPFDLGFVNTELERMTFPILKNKAIDTLPLSRWAYPKLGKYNLQFLAEQLKIEVRNAHRADDDARVCMEVFLRCVNDTMSIQKKIASPQEPSLF
jgi:DNA polymerase III epsilon subunit family exonuclease